MTPPVQGWTLIQHTLNLGADSPESIEFLVEHLERLSQKFGEAHHYSSYRVVNYASWFVARNGTLERGLSYSDDTGFIANMGRVMTAEKKLGFAYLDGQSINALETLDLWEEDTSETHSENRSDEESDNEFNDRRQYRLPQEEDPLALATAWSENPMTLGVLGQPASVGTLGVLKGP